MDAQHIVCELCRKLVPVSNTRYIPKGKEAKMLICNSCITKRNDNDDVTGNKKPSVKKDSFFCRRCKYKFKHDTSSKSYLRCPYCGKSDLIVENKMQSADQILKSLDEDY